MTAQTAQHTSTLRKTRVGVILGCPPRTWQAQVVSSLERSPYVELQVRSAWAPSAPARTAPGRGAGGPAGADAPLLEVGTEAQAESWGGLDVLLWLAHEEPPASLHDVARHGLWRFRHGDDPPETPGLAAFARGEPVRVRLVRCRPDADEVLHDGWLPSAPYRYADHLDTIFGVTAGWVERVIRELATGSLPARIEPNPAPNRPRSRLGPSTAARVGVRAAQRFVQSFTRRATWQIGIVDRPIGSFARGGVLNDGEVRWLDHEIPHGYLADPIGVSLADGRRYIFAEELRFDTLRGRLVALEEERDGDFSAPRPLDLGADADDIHMSFPHVFRHGGAWWCVPERQNRREVALYRAVEFPWRWRREVTLLRDIAACDSVLFRHDGLWWLFTTDQGKAGGALLAFWSERLTGPYTPHLLNPLRVDLATSRSAGPVFRADGRLYRSAQDGRAGYGAAVAVLEILALDPMRFRERRSGLLVPDPRGRCPEGVHTLSPLGRSATLVDGKRWITDRAHARRQLRYKLVRR